MDKISTLILSSSLLAISTLCFGADISGSKQHGSKQHDTEQYRYSDGSQNDNDWSDTPWGQKPPPVNRGYDNNSMPWSADSPIGIGDSNPVWKTGNSLWRDWDTNKWGGNGMPWGGNNSMMPWSKDKKKKKYNKNYAPRGYAYPYQGGYTYPYPGAYGNRPY